MIAGGAAAVRATLARTHDQTARQLSDMNNQLST